MTRVSSFGKLEPSSPYEPFCNSVGSFEVVFSLRVNDLQHRPNITSHYLEQSASRTIRLPPTLLPVSKRSRANTNQEGKLILREMVAPPELLYIRNFHLEGSGGALTKDVL